LQQDHCDCFWPISSKSANRSMLISPKVNTQHLRRDDTSTSRSHTSQSPIPSNWCRLGHSRQFAALRVPLQTLQVGSYFGSMLVSQVPILVQAFVDDPFQFCWQVRVQPHCRCWRPIKNRFENNSRTLSAKRQCPCRHFIQYCAKGEQICPCI